jgi:hypothetical protein
MKPKAQCGTLGQPAIFYFGSYVYRFQFVRHFLIAGLHIVPPVSPHYQIDCCPSETQSQRIVIPSGSNLRLKKTPKRDSDLLDKLTCGKPCRITNGTPFQACRFPAQNQAASAYFNLFWVSFARSRCSWITFAVSSANFFTSASLPLFASCLNSARSFW